MTKLKIKTSDGLTIRQIYNDNEKIINELKNITNVLTYDMYILLDDDYFYFSCEIENDNHTVFLYCTLEFTENKEFIIEFTNNLKAN